MPIKFGNNSEITIKNTDPSVLKKININCGNNCEIFIDGLNSVNKGLTIYMNDNGRLIIGKNQMMNGPVEIFLHEPATVKIGQDCLWAKTQIWASDMHSIIDTTTNQRINCSEDIEIGDRIWFGADSLILKGSRVGDDCIIGARSVVTKSTPMQANCVLVGSPAGIVRRNVRWDFNMIPKPTQLES